MSKQIPGKCFRCGRTIERGYTLCPSCGNKLHENDREQAKADMCQNYCKYPDIWDEEKEGIELCESDICANCPLNRL